MIDRRDQLAEAIGHDRSRLGIADALLPVVDRLIREAQADALTAAAAEQRAEAGNVPDTDEGTHADGHRCAADFLDRRAAALRGRL